MNGTLVAFYGEREDSGLRKLIEELQAELTSALGTRFKGYDLRQVHATITGLEGKRVEGEILSSNFAKLRGQLRLISFEKVASVLRATGSPLFTATIGGYRPETTYNQQSRGEHLWLRSFSIQANVAVAMGWPDPSLSDAFALDRLRRELGDAGALHAYHNRPSNVDNDLFFRVGLIDRRGLDGGSRKEVTCRLRDLLSDRPPLSLDVTSESLSIVAYDDPTLPWTECRVFDPEQIGRDPDPLIQLYELAA